MRIAVIAADGRLGRVFVEKALSRGHVVRAGVRGPHNLRLHDNLEIVTCDALKRNDVAVLLRDQEVVVSAIGHVKGSLLDLQTRATNIVIDTMRTQGIARFVDVTGTGVRFLGDKISLVDRLLNLAVYCIDRNRVIDGREHQEVLKTSGVDWTTIRILKLQNIASRPYSLSLNGPTKWYVGRSEVAEAMIEVIEKRHLLKKLLLLATGSRR